MTSKNNTLVAHLRSMQNILTMETLDGAFCNNNIYLSVAGNFWHSIIRILSEEKPVFVLLANAKIDAQNTLLTEYLMPWEKWARRRRIWCRRQQPFSSYCMVIHQEYPYPSWKIILKTMPCLQHQSTCSCTSCGAGQYICHVLESSRPASLVCRVHSVRRVDLEWRPSSCYCPGWPTSTMCTWCDSL